MTVSVAVVMVKVMVMVMVMVMVIGMVMVMVVVCGVWRVTLKTSECTFKTLSVCTFKTSPQHNMHFCTSSSTWWSPFGNACPATLGVAAALHLDKPMQWSTTHKYISIGKTSSLSAYRRRPRVRSSYRAPTVCSKAVFGLVLWRSSMWTSKWTSSWESKENCGATPERPSRPDVKSTHLVPALRPCNCLRKRPQYGGSVPHLGLGLAVQLDGPRSSLRIRPCLSTRL